MSNDGAIHYRTVYGKLFSGLLHQFGAAYVSEIEDAIQNAFLKSLKMGKQRPANKENWLFIVARNDVLNQLKRKQKENRNSTVENFEESTVIRDEKDLRLQTILFIAGVENSSKQAKILFVLKNIWFKH